MLSVEKVRALLNDPTLSDEEVEQIRDEFYELVQIIFEGWEEEKRSRGKEELQT